VDAVAATLMTVVAERVAPAAPGLFTVVRSILLEASVDRDDHSVPDRGPEVLHPLKGTSHVGALDRGRSAIVRTTLRHVVLIVQIVLKLQACQ
jgi:hypothetical protein